MTLKELFIQLAIMYGIEDQIAALLHDRPAPEPIGLGPLLRQARHAAGGTIAGTHKRSGISRSQLSFYELGQQWSPGIRTIQALSYGYRIPFALVLAAALNDAGPWEPAAPGAVRTPKGPPKMTIPEVRKRKRTGVR